MESQVDSFTEVVLQNRRVLDPISMHGFRRNLLFLLAGPLILTLIGLMVGPCILNCMANYIKQLVNSGELLVLRTNYVLLEQDKSMI